MTSVSVFAFSLLQAQSNIQQSLSINASGAAALAEAGIAVEK